MKTIIFTTIFTLSNLLCGDINLEIKNLNSDCGLLKIGLYDSNIAFPIVGKAFKYIESKETSAKQYKFHKIPNGIYAIALFCDENQNGKLDTNLFGIPKEAYGFSNNPKVFGKPSFDDAKFELQDTKNLLIKVQK